MEEEISIEDIFPEQTKALTLKSLEKQMNEKLAEMQTKIFSLERNIENIKKSLRRH